MTTKSKPPTPAPARLVARPARAGDAKDLAAIARRLDADGHPELAGEYEARADLLRAHEQHLTELSKAAGTNPGGSHANRGKRIADWLLTAGWTPPAELLLDDAPPVAETEG